ncbi:unnamed protein product [Orchesella dallaii]|uniref:Uncharacterized protein n=1 Tax=Orchesella dallaii TaxID=48710 RepID=A0ABP1R8D8_9HEXA
MGSTPSPLRSQKSVKFHMEEKPSIKITVSSDALAETILKNNIPLQSSPTSMDGVEANGSGQSLIQIVGNCCGSNNGVNSMPNGVLCNCANGDDKRTRIALDDFTVLEFPNCVDFGIKDFLCCKDEIELDLSSDTDASFLDATPPHRFSDSELENQIEAMSITLDTQLNPHPNRHPFQLDSENLTTPEDEITEESFIMDEEEVSSSASTSAATICGVGGGSGDLEEHDDHDHLSITSSDLTDITCPQSISTDDAEPAQSITPTLNDDTSAESPSNSEEEEDKQSNDNSSEITNGCGEVEVSTSTATAHELQDENLENEKENMGTESSSSTPSIEKASFCQSQNQTDEQMVTSESGNSPPLFASSASPPQEQRDGKPANKTAQVISTSKMLKHPTKHFKRQISLPASIFMSYLIEQNNKANYCIQQQSDNLNHHHSPNIGNNCEVIVKNKLNRSNSCTNKKYNKPNNHHNHHQGIMQGMRAPLAKIDSYRSTKVIHGSTEDYDDDDINNSNGFETNEDFSRVGGKDPVAGFPEGMRRSIDDDSPLLDCNDELRGSNSSWTWESKSDSFPETDDQQDIDIDDNDEQQAFTSEVEKKSLILRHVRRLIRQDTTGNFAPPDFSI